MTLKVLLFGGRGQLGHELRAIGADGDLELHAPSRAQCDVSDRCCVERAIGATRPAVVVNAAAFTDVDGAESDRTNAYLTNAGGAEAVADVCGRQDIPLIHVSTDYVFDGAKRAPYVEDDPTSPINVYGASKAAGDDAVRRLARRHIIIRTSWLFGRYRSNFLVKMLRLAQRGIELAMVEDEIGSPTPSHDLARAVVAASRRASANDVAWRTYHFAGSAPASRYEFASEILSLHGRQTGVWTTMRPIKRADYPSAAQRPADSRLDSALFAATFGIEAEPWPRTCARLVELLSPATSPPT